MAILLKQVYNHEVPDISYIDCSDILKFLFHVASMTEACFPKKVVVGVRMLVEGELKRQFEVMMSLQNK